MRYTIHDPESPLRHTLSGQGISRHKYGFYYTAIAQVITATGAGILFTALFDWLY